MAEMIREGKPISEIRDYAGGRGDLLVGVVLRAELLKEGEAADEE